VVKYEARIRFHSDPRINTDILETQATSFFAFVESLISQNKFDVFRALYRHPSKSVELVDQIYAFCEKVFYGKDAVTQYFFKSESAAERWDLYRVQKLKATSRWKEDGIGNLKSRPNSVLIVDMPEDSDEAYWYWLDFRHVIDYELESDGVQFKHIIFEQEGDKLAVFDQDSIRIFNYKDKKLGELLKEFRHDLGYCLARFSVSKSVSLSEKHIKVNPISNQLGELDWYLFFAVSERHLDLHGPWPIYWGFITDCEYRTADNSREGFVYCHRGFLRREEDNTYVMSREGSRGHGYSPKPCPVCSQKRINGPGSFVGVSPPDPDNEGANLREPVGFVGVDRASLDYVTEKRKKYALDIYQSATGYGGEPINDQAVNEKQVMASFESRAQMLRNLKKEFEGAQKWVEETICRLMFPNDFVSAHIDYGTEWYLVDSGEILDRYMELRGEAGDIALDRILKDYYETKNRNNPEELARIRVMNDLEPMRHVSKKEASDLYKDGHIGAIDYVLKLRFSDLIAEFERKNQKVHLFGVELDYNERIKRIREEMVRYVEENMVVKSEDQLQDKMNVYGVAVRAGAVTPQSQDEEYFRQRMGVPGMSQEARTAWDDGGNIRRPVTLKSEVEIEKEIDDNSNQ
jgi:hypothetical protein